MQLKLGKKEKKEKPVSGKGKIASASRGAKFVIFLGDEGAILIHTKGNTVLSRQFVPDASEQNLREFRQTLLKDIQAPIILVVDSMDQSYMQQTLPPVSAISVNKLIKRRLERDFAGNDIKGAILLGREKSGRKDWNFLMVALEKSPQLTVWLDFIQDQPHRFLGIYLASVEAELLVKRLEQVVGTEKDEGGDEWKFFVSHNKVGGFRQVILKNGRIIFTRLAQPVGDSNAEVIAGGIEQEMLSTIEYMKRLSFSPQNRLDIYIVTSSAIKAVIDGNKFGASSLHILTPYEVANYLGIEGAAQPTDQFGDVVMAASVGISRKHVLKLSAPQTKRVDQYHQFVLYQRSAAALIITGILGYAGYTGYGIFQMGQELSNLESRKDNVQRDLDMLRANIKDTKLDVEKASDLIDLYQQMKKEKVSPLPFLRHFEVMARAPVWVKAVEWTLGTDSRVETKIAGNAASSSGRGARNAPPPASVPPAVAPPGSDKKMTVVLTLEFPKEASDPKLFRVLLKKILEDFKKLFAGYEVDYLTLPAEAIENEKLEIKSGVTKEASVRSLDVQLYIKGDVMPEAVPEAVKNAASNPVIPDPAGGHNEQKP